MRYRKNIADIQILQSQATNEGSLIGSKIYWCHQLIMSLTLLFCLQGKTVNSKTGTEGLNLMCIIQVLIVLDMACIAYLYSNQTLCREFTDEKYFFGTNIKVCFGFPQTDTEKAKKVSLSYRLYAVLYRMSPNCRSFQFVHLCQTE